MNLNEISRFISLILRHKPEVIGISLDEHGWAEVDQLIAGIGKIYPMNNEILEEIVRTDSKHRYSFSNDKKFIRANQGHSINVDVELKKEIPPCILYHGSGKKYMESIDRNGLVSKSRLFVHLSEDETTAITVGKRHGEPIVYKVNAQKMKEDGFEFFVSANGVWLTKLVPIQYLEKLG